MTTRDAETRAIPISTATPDDRERMLSTLMLAFIRAPKVRWLYPEPHAYATFVPRLFDAMGGRAFEHGTAFYAGHHYTGVALWLAAVNALYRDVRLALPFLVQLAMLVTPVVYTAPSVLGSAPTWVAIAYGLNPMAGIAEGFRFALLGGSPPWALLATAAASTTALLASGLVVFRRLERVFADRV